MAITKLGTNAQVEITADLDLNGYSVKYTGTPSTDHAVSGGVISLTAGTNLVFGDLCYMGSDGKMEKGDYNAVATSFCWAMALATINEDASGLFALPSSIVRDDSWNWTSLGQPVYLGTTGGLTQSSPTGEDDVIQVIGIATHADRILFYPQLVQVEYKV